ncbi:MucBP domain-containing protein [Levilactobacillus humaensis]|uniref:MucBP domain-containing protein n=1 Tax=Levilactobacillus humaensis TaxID=2950375 RepID=UPI0021C3C172|nr:MucBP domain-containing protein [Levilactobacillus humaensis]
MNQDLHNRSKNRPNNTHVHNKIKDLLFAGVVLTSLNVGLLNGPSKKASADTSSPNISASSSSLTRKPSTQTLSKSLGQTSSERTTPSDATNDASVAPDAPTNNSIVPADTNDGSTTNDNDTKDSLNDDHSNLSDTSKVDTESKADATPQQVNTSGIDKGEVDVISHHAVQKGTVSVHYKTDTGGELYKEVITGNVGEKFTVNALDFNDGDAKDFLLKGARQISGIYTSKAQTTTFFYQVPKVHASFQNEMNVYKVTYADDSLKYVQIIDGNFDITLGKNSQGQSLVAIQSIGMPSANRMLSLSNKEIANIEKRFGYFNTQKYSYILEKSYNSTYVKVMKINNKSGDLTVKTINLNASDYTVDSVSKALGISPKTKFKTFWNKFGRL